MKIYQLLPIALFALVSCQDSVLQQDLVTSNTNVSSESKDGMQRVVVSSRSELSSIIAQMRDSEHSRSRAVGVGNLPPGQPFIMSDNQELFQSLVEANRQKVMASLTPEQLDSINNDEDELEFCPEDSVIADIHFAQMLNADREIQVGDTIFKYFANGVAYTVACHESELREVEEQIGQIEVTPDNEGHILNFSRNVDFMPIYFSKTPPTYDIIDSGQTIFFEDQDYEDIKQIPASDIRDIYYTYGESKQGDGNWWHRTFSNFFGNNVTAINKFTNNKKLTLHFYDQNYLIYAAIGTDLKMQKRVCGIWWNIKAEKMIHGWETVTVAYTMPDPIPPTTFDHPGMTNPTITTTNPSNIFFTTNKILFKIPFTDYDFTAKDLTKAYKIAASKAYNYVSDWAKKQAKTAEKIDLMACKNDTAYIVHGPCSTTATNCRSINSKFYAKWFAGVCELQFSVGSLLKLKNVVFDKNDGVELYSGRVYGAIKYKGRWLAARITQYPPNPNHKM